MGTKKTSQPLFAGLSAWLKWGGLITFVVLAIAVAAVSFRAVRELTMGWELTQLEGVPVRPTETATATVPAASPPAAGITGSTPSVVSSQTPVPATPTPIPPPIILPTPDPWDGTSRVTILLLGLDYADWESEDRLGPPRSDTMMLLTIDPLAKTAGMLSIPRDLWVTMPGIEGYHKINTAHRFGELYNMTGGGPGLAMRTVERLLGVPIQYYARLDFYAFEEFIDELGGVEVDVPEEIQVDPIGENNTVVLEPGPQLLDGPVALGYARARNTRGGDFDRARRQQQVVMAIRDRILSLDMLPQLVLKAPELYRNLSEGIQTNLTVQEAIQLAWLAQEIEAEDIKSAQIGSNEVIYGTAPDGQAFFQPIPSRIRILRDEIFGSNMGALMEGISDAEALLSGEQARIVIYSVGSAMDEAEHTADYLRGQGLTVLSIEEIDPEDVDNRMVDYTGNPYTLKTLVSLLGIELIESRFTSGSEVDIAIYLGADWQAP